jgi:hypothetical protein
VLKILGIAFGICARASVRASVRASDSLCVG